MSRNRTNTRILNREFLYTDSPSGKPITICKTTFECKVHESIIDHLTTRQVDNLLYKFMESGAEFLDVTWSTKFKIYKMCITRQVVCNVNDTYDEELGKSIASTKCQIAIFNLMKNAMQYAVESAYKNFVLYAAGCQCSNEIAEYDEKLHLDYLLDKIQSK